MTTTFYVIRCRECMAGGRAVDEDESMVEALAAGIVHARTEHPDAAVFALLEMEPGSPVVGWDGEQSPATWFNGCVRPGF